MTDASSHARMADRLWQAETDRVPIPPLTESSDLAVEDGYAIQTVNVERRLRAGGAARGRKVGHTSWAAQHLPGVTEPDSGVLVDDMFLEDGDEMPFGTLLQPRVVAELAFLLDRDLAGPGVTTVHAVQAVAGVLPVIEVLDSRIADWRGAPADTVADNMSAGRVVLGGRVVPVTGLDLRLIGVLLFRNGLAMETGAGAAALGNPARSLAWLANTLGRRGSGLRRDDLVLSGPLHRIVPARVGDVFRARFAHLGAVTAVFGMPGTAA